MTLVGTSDEERLSDLRPSPLDVVGALRALGAQGPQPLVQALLTSGEMLSHVWVNPLSMQDLDGGCILIKAEVYASESCAGYKARNLFSVPRGTSWGANESIIEEIILPEGWYLADGMLFEV